MSKAATQAPVVVAAPAAANGLLLRQCECGNHTIAGGECAECGKEKTNSRATFGSLGSAGFADPRMAIQAQLIVGPTDDPFEREADRVADQVSSPGPIRRAAPRIQRYSPNAATRPVTTPSSVSSVLAGPGYRLDSTIRRDMESRFGQDFSRVRVHSGASAEESARELDARAYTVGEHIVFGAGQFQPDSQAGRHLIAHELTHVVQQSGANAIPNRESRDTNVWSGIPSTSQYIQVPIRLAPLNRIFRAVNPQPVVRHDRLTLLGDGTPGNPGIKVEEFQGYITSQADWFTHPSLSNDDRDHLWSIVYLLQEGDHIGTGLANVRLADLAAAKPAEMNFIRAYAEGATVAAQTVRITRPADTISRIVQLGTAMVELKKFVPGPVLRICIDQTGLEAMVDENLVTVLELYYKHFSPTIENPAEQGPLLTLLRGGIATLVLLIGLKGWVHDLHALTPRTRDQLAKNVDDKTRSRPVLLILMSGLDWNAAFLQGQNLEAAVLNPKNLALVIQGATKLADETAQLNKVADDYGQVPKGGGKARLGQVVIAGHGQATSVEQATKGTGAQSRKDTSVAYDEEDINPIKPGDDSELLIDALLSRMDPKDARVVFAGCLVGSHDIAETPGLANKKTAAADINASIQNNPNLRDLVNKRMAALKITGTVQAANASTTFGAFNLDPSGKARLSLDWDPDVGGSKADYVKTGAEPEGALRAALETWADPKFGPAWTTKEMRKHVAKTITSKEWWISLTRTAFERALPKPGADVEPAVLANLAHRVEAWLLTGWDDSADAEELTKAVTADDAKVLYPVMLGSDLGTQPHLAVVVQQAWMTADLGHEAAFLAAINATTLKRVRLSPLIKDPVVKPHLASLLKTADPKKPSRPQLILALLIAVREGGAMPAEVKTLLTNAAGGVKTVKFPAALGVPALLDGARELDVLQDLGLAPGAPAAQGGAAQADDANVDLDSDKINETFVAVAPRKVVLASYAYARTLPKAGSKALRHYAKGNEVRVVGTTAGWTVIDVEGKIGFIDQAL